MNEYNWPGQYKPFAHQRITSQFLVERKRAFCFNEQGTGKTASVIWAVDYLMNIGVIRRVLVVCPLSIMKSAWQNDLFKFAMHRSCDIAYGDRKKRAKIISGDAEFVIINFDGLEIVKEEVLAGGFDLIVIDEASAYKNPSTERWKTLRDIAKTVKGLWMLTGTPAAQSPIDAYGLAKLINPKGVPQFAGQFRDQVMIKLGMYRWIPRPNAQEIVFNALQPAIRFEKDQCLDLPDVTFVEREAPLTPQQSKYYKILKDNMLMKAAGEEVSSANAAVSINKLLQISGGAVYTDTREVVEFDISNRIKVVLEVIEESTHKVLVFVPFTHTIELLKDYLTKHSISCEVISGSVPVSKRNDIIQDFQSTERVKVLIIQPQAASHGLTLTAANTIIWYAPVMSVETYLQANARINRFGQKNAMTIVHIKGSDVETRLYRMLSSNIDNHTKIIDLYRQEIEESS
jgi:SNF2 family DNA or RNA helicase